jgi:hypothetical protein
MDARIQLLAIAASGSLLVLVLEVVRRKRFLERYALLWLLSPFVILGLSIWQSKVMAQRLALIRERVAAAADEHPARQVAEAEDARRLEPAGRG